MCIKVLLPKFMDNRIQKIANSGVFAEHLDTEVELDVPFRGIPAILHIMSAHNGHTFEHSQDYPELPYNISYPYWETLIKHNRAKVDSGDIAEFRRAMLQNTPVARGYWQTRAWQHFRVLPILPAHFPPDVNLHTIMDMVDEDSDWMLVGETLKLDLSGYQDPNGMSRPLSSNIPVSSNDFRVHKADDSREWIIWVRQSEKYNAVIVGYNKKKYWVPLLAHTKMLKGNIPTAQTKDTFRSTIKFVEEMVNECD